MEKFDLIVIGSGPSGGRVAMRCAEKGWNVAIAESRSFGGNCALRGCNPKKVFVHAAEVVAAARQSHGKLCDAGAIKIEWPNLLAWKNEFTQPVPESSRKKFEDAGITLFDAAPKFVARNTLEIDGNRYQSKHILIAVGGKPAELEFEGAQYMTLSDQFMELKELPKRIVFVGGGYISTEFACVARHADSEVTILQRGARPLKGFEAFTVDKFVSKATDIGISIQCEVKVTEVVKHHHGSFEVSYEDGSGQQTIEADLVVHGAGRIPNLEGLELAQGEVEFDPKKGVNVDEFLRSVSNPIVFASGDCAATGKARLTPTANQQGFVISSTMLTGEETLPDYGPIPKVCFSIPPIASVGMTEESAERTGADYRIQSGDMSDWGSVRKVCESHAAFKLVIDKQSDKILGAHLLGPSAAETINLFAIAMRAGMTARDLKATLLAFPTFSSDVRQMV